MKKVTSIRIDDEFLDMTEELRKLYKQVLGFDLKKSDILEGCLRQGMRYYITSLNRITTSPINGADGDNMQFSEDIVKAIYEFEAEYMGYLVDQELIGKAWYG